MASELLGFRELDAQLKALGDAATGRELRNALFQAALPAVQAIRAAAPVGDVAHRTYLGRLVAPGFLSRNIRRKVMLRSQSTHAVVLVGPGSEAFYAEFLEHGTKKLSARPFVEPAFRSSQHSVIARLGERLARQIARSASRRR